jgi:hypothetical protein
MQQNRRLNLRCCDIVAIDLEQVLHIQFSIRIHAWYRVNEPYTFDRPTI